MKKLVILCSVVWLCSTAFSQPSVILDADIDSDVDDVAALAMLHTLVSTKHIKLAGVIVTSDDPYSALCTDAINTYFQHGNIPIGFLKKQPQLKNHSKYTRQISEEFPHRLKSYTDAWEAVALYRKLLSDSKNNSVVIITIGHLSSLQDLLKSGADKYSRLNGKELAQKKVSKWICMGGIFPSGKEANFYRPDPGSTVYCLTEWTDPVIFCGWEVGKQIISGGQDLKKDLNAESPVYRAFELYNNFAGRPSWDQVAVLLLNDDYRKYFDLVQGGYCQVDADGSNRWVLGTKGNHSYIVLKTGTDVNEIAAKINNMSKK
jgi:hypothetical protein